ncbi:hypothetical protein K7957_05075 [Sphingomonas yunnanensis]|uniref:hypothetical protein n=1 Tax=Sphingomonas yunnanensis TaxID=310400 RepID=UPI001CA72A3C|nr:hypothetical protein [Sphingomonas yunnanensis]MBY9062301.1 hypothetical protein [Sphingomonas yunnanensis]
MTTKTITAARDFKDAGTERQFKAGEAITDVDAGAIDNYRAAGLIAEAGADEASEAPAPARRTRRTRAKAS